MFEVASQLRSKNLPFLLLYLSAHQKMIDEVMMLTKDMVYVDIGHGIGNTCMQAAFTVGCEARGIEVVGKRNDIAGIFYKDLLEQHDIIHRRDQKVRCDCKKIVLSCLNSQEKISSSEACNRKDPSATWEAGRPGASRIFDRRRGCCFL